VGNPGSDEERFVVYESRFERGGAQIMKNFVKLVFNGAWG